VNAYLLVLYFFTAFTIAILFFPVLIKLLRKWELFDNPINHKIHKDFTPSMGGVAILLGVVFTLLISLPFQEWANFKYFFVALSLMFITGLRDDILTLDPKRKLIGQLMPVLVLVVFGQCTLSSFYDAWSITFPIWLSWLATIFTIIILTNAYNLIDGIDGLAGTISLVILIFFGYWFFIADDFYLSVIAFAFAGSIVAFLIFNWQPSKIFMGDTGALAIGFVISYLAIQFINYNYRLPSESAVRFEASISTAICVLIIPVFDTLRVIILRIRKFQSPFKADRNHLHHQFLNLGFSHHKTTLSLAALNISFVVMAFILRNQPDKLILPITIALCLLVNQVLKMALKYSLKNETDNNRSSI
jgi:UDP-N-acetylmuramyl pentapeptide phosphotransferase/UDP-N-acetylglucosamine-1-phosphate transferase